MTDRAPVNDFKGLYPLGLSEAQLLCLQACVGHEIYRVQGRAKDDRLGDQTREAEAATLGTLRGLLDRLRRLRGE